MAGFTTHYIFGSDMINILREESAVTLIKKYRKVYNLGLQGPDIFFYNPFIAGGADNHKYGKIMHKYNTNQFFSNAIDYINNLSSNNRKYKTEVIKTYLYGFLAHYALDTHVHPYVYCRAGYDPMKDNAGQSFGVHSLIEINIDKKYLMKRIRVLPSRFYQHKTVKISKEEQLIIEEFLTYCIFKTYYKNAINKKNEERRLLRYIKRQVKLSICIHRVFLYVLHDKHGIKRKIVQFFDKYILGHVSISNIILTDSIKDTLDAMNIKHKEWRHPWNISMYSKESFHDLYEKSGRYYIKLITEITKSSNEHKFISDEMKKYILELIDDRSYHSGMKSKVYSVI